MFQLINTLKNKVVKSASMAELQESVTELGEISSSLDSDISQDLDAIEYYMSKRRTKQSDED
jgi:hypothetical protein